MLQPESHRVGLGVRAEFVHEAFVGERILNSQRRSEWSGEERRTYCMRQCPFTPDGSAASTAATNAPGEVGWNCVALVPKLAGRGLGGGSLRQLGFIPQQHAGDDIPWLIVARPITQRSYPVFPCPGHDASIECQRGTMFPRRRGTEVLPHHFVLT